MVLLLDADNTVFSPQGKTNLESRSRWLIFLRQRPWLLLCQSILKDHDKNYAKSYSCDDDQKQKQDVS